MVTVIVPPGASVPLERVQVTAAFELLQLITIEEPPDTTVATVGAGVRPLMKAGTVSVMRTPVAAVVALLLRTTSV
jgi:hypothetical protein